MLPLLAHYCQLDMIESSDWISCLLGHGLHLFTGKMVWLVKLSQEFSSQIVMYDNIFPLSSVIVGVLCLLFMLRSKSVFQLSWTQSTSGSETWSWTCECQNQCHCPQYHLKPCWIQNPQLDCHQWELHMLCRRLHRSGSLLLHTWLQRFPLPVCNLTILVNCLYPQCCWMQSW